MENTNLHQSKKNKNDEFYTRYQEIDNEMKFYNLKGLSIYAPCDDYRISNFKKYFVEHFHELGISRFCCTNFDNGNGSYKYEYDGVEERITPLIGNGDFRSEECTKIKNEYDTIITNPPFSLFREFIKWINCEKLFLLIGNMNAITYKEIFPLIKSNQMWWGCSLNGIKCSFIVPESYEGNNVYVEDGIRYGKVNNAIWYTNITHTKRRTPLELTETYSADKYTVYDNYDAIEVNKVAKIPKDFQGVIGVPITFLDKYCPEQFEIIKFRKGDDDKDLSVNGKCPYFRILIQKKELSS